MKQNNDTPDVKTTGLQWPPKWVVGRVQDVLTLIVGPEKAGERAEAVSTAVLMVPVLLLLVATSLGAVHVVRTREAIAAAPAPVGEAVQAAEGEPADQGQSGNIPASNALQAMAQTFLCNCVRAAANIASIPISAEQPGNASEPGVNPQPQPGLESIQAPELQPESSGGGQNGKRGAPLNRWGFG